MHGALGPGDQLFQAFPLGGETKTLVVEDVWTDLTGANDRKLVMLRVPLGSKRVLLRWSTEPLANTLVEVAQVASSWPLDNLIQPFSVDRDRDDGVRFYLGVDPTDDGDGTAVVAVNVMFGG